MPLHLNLGGSFVFSDKICVQSSQADLDAGSRSSRTERVQESFQPEIEDPVPAHNKFQNINRPRKERYMLELNTPCEGYRKVRCCWVPEDLIQSAFNWKLVYMMYL